MTDGGLLGFGVLIFLSIVLYVFRDQIRHRINIGGVDAGFELPFGTKVWAKFTEIDTKANLSDTGLPESEVKKITASSHTIKREKVSAIFKLGALL